MSILSDNMKYLRRENGLSQQKLGELVGCSYDCISNIEVDKLRGDSAYLQAIANHFGISAFTLKYVSIIPEVRRWRSDEQKCKQIEDKLILRGHCIATNNKFEDPNNK